MRELGFAVCLFLAVSSAMAAEAAMPVQFVVIVNKQNPADSANPGMVSSLFLKRSGKWPGGLRAQPVDLVGASRTREGFSRRILGQRVSDVEQYWQKEIFSGHNIPPPKKVSEAEVVSYVGKRPGAIGYVSAATPLPPQVKVLRIQEN